MSESLDVETTLCIMMHVNMLALFLFFSNSSFNNLRSLFHHIYIDDETFFEPEISRIVLFNDEDNIEDCQKCVAELII